MAFTLAMAKDPRLRCTLGEIGSSRATLQQLIEILPGASSGYSFDLLQLDGTAFDKRLTTGGVELRLRYQNTRGQVPMADREMGGETAVSPLFNRVLEEENYWISVSIKWDADNDRRKPYLFRTAGLTLFQGAFSQRPKMQLLRAEWAGLRQSGEDDYVYEAHGAGHPHWQIDAPRALRDWIRFRREQEAARRTLYEGPAVIQEVAGLDELLAATTLSVAENEDPDISWCSMHLALNAPWHAQPWKREPVGSLPHAHHPSGFNQIADWATWTVSYVQQEIGRAVGLA